jgi:hypothetical protein
MSASTGWFRPCNFGDCAEVMETDGAVWVRSSRNPEAVAAFTVEEWQRFRADVKAGRFDDIAPADDQVELERLRGIEQRARAIFDDPQPNNWRGAAFHILTGDIDE